MSRAFILVIDSLGIGAAHDADQYGDTGADTLVHIAEACRTIRGQDLHLPNLVRLVLGRAHRLRSGKTPQALAADGDISAAYGCANPRSSRKDTPSGHREMAGLPVLFDWGFFPKT